MSDWERLILGKMPLGQTVAQGTLMKGLLRRFG
jgi:hypothetical protein